MKQTKGVIYILTNPSFPEYVKIGYASDLKARLKVLNNSSSVPYSFRAYATYDVEENLTDKKLHSLIDRLNPDLRAIEKIDGKKRVREFYAMTKEDAYSILECIATISGTEKRLKLIDPTETEKEEEKKAEEIETEARRGPFRFDKLGIKAGEEIVYTKDSTVKAVVVDARHIQYGDEVTSLSALACKLEMKKNLCGPLFFTYNGKILADLRDEKEN